MGGSSQHRDPGFRDVRELDRVVRSCRNGLGQVLADLPGIDIETCHELDVSDVVTTEVDVHETWHLGVDVGVCVVGHTLHQ